LNTGLNYGYIFPEIVFSFKKQHLTLNLFEVLRSKKKNPPEVKADRPDNDILDLLEVDLNSGFRLVVERFSRRLYWHIRRLVILHEDADDALQNTFLNAWRNISGFRNQSSIYTWLYAIATNEALSLINKRKRNSAISLDGLESWFASSAEGNSWFDGDEASIKLQNAVLKLPEKQRVVFNLKYYEDMTYEDISVILGTSVGALKASYHHAVRKIENLLSSF
jgi:RNA polymerase sigma-70 factor (ECF subfamily)